MAIARVDSSWSCFIARSVRYDRWLPLSSKRRASIANLGFDGLRMTVRAVCSNMALPGAEQSVLVVFKLKAGASGLRSAEAAAELGFSLGRVPLSQMEVWCFPRQFLHLPADGHSFARWLLRRQQKQRPLLSRIFLRAYTSDAVVQSTEEWDCRQYAQVCCPCTVATKAEVAGRP